MMRNSSFILSFPLILLSIHFVAQAALQAPPDHCGSTQYSKLCRSMLKSLPAMPSSTQLGIHSVELSLQQAMKTSNVVKHYLVPKSGLFMSRGLRGVLRYCLSLSESTIYYLKSILILSEQEDLASMNKEKAARIHTMLSGVLGNNLKCIDGLKEMNNSIAESLSHDIKMYRVSLNLVTQALNPNHPCHHHFHHHQKRSRGLTHELKAPKPVHIPLDHLIESIRQTNCNSLENCSIKDCGSAFDIDGRGILIGSIVTVGQTGHNKFNSVQRAIEATPPKSKGKNGYHVIYVRKGVYDEHISIPKDRNYIMLLGDGINKTIFTGNKYSSKGMGSFHIASFAANGLGFMAVDITFRNTAGPDKGAAMAARINSDKSSFYRCSFEGYQDTLLNQEGRQFFRECDIYGTVDFIFGSAIVAFQTCNIYTRKPLFGQETTITAQGRDDANSTGVTSFQNCTIKPAPDLANDMSFSKNYLGRPWKPYSSVVILQSYIDKHIHPKGWIPFRSNMGLNTLYYGEYDNCGPGSNTTGRVNWKGYHVLHSQQALNFTVYNLTMSNWLSKTDIPYFKGLM